MITLINKNISELSETAKNANSSTLTKINRIKKAIQSQTPDDILLNLQKSGNLSKYFEYWESRSSQDPEKIKDTFQNKSRPVIEILIDLHILKSINEPSKIKWTAPVIIPVYDPGPAIMPIKSDFQRLNDLLALRARITGGQSMVDFAETCLVTNGPKKGNLIKLSDAPYSRRALSLMDPSHKCRLLILMWASQSMKSVCAQIPTTFYTKIVPSECLYATTDLEMMKKTMNRRLTPMIEHQGVEFITQSTTRASRKTGDTTLQKEFAGGNLDGVTQGSSAAMASETKRFFAADELGNWKAEVGNQGNSFWQGWARLKAWGEEKKCIVPSTPGNSGSCMVEHLFETGTQEKWTVHCPLCGSPQVLEVQNKEGYGLTWSTKRGTVVEPSIVYVCCKCGDSFTEKRKWEIQQDGFWQKPKDLSPVDEYTYSLQLHSINSMFEMWFEIASAYERSREDPGAKKYYDNHICGMPHKVSGARIDSALVEKNRGTYKRQTVPDGVCIVVIGGDVQRGAVKHEELTDQELEIKIGATKKEAEKEDDESILYDQRFPRIEIEVFGTGPAYRGWSIDYKVFYGKVDNAYSGAFQKFYEWCQVINDRNKCDEYPSGMLGFKREHDNKMFNVRRILLDSGYNAPVVYEFTKRLVNTYPIKDEREITPSKNKKNNALHQSFFVPWKKSNLNSGVTLYVVSQKMYISSLHRFLKIERTDDDIQPGNFQDFPREYGKRYFEMLTADELMPSGEYDNKGRPNEARACRIYGMVGCDDVIDSTVKYWRDVYKKEKKWTDQQIEGINSRWAIEYLAKESGIDQGYLVTKIK